MSQPKPKVLIENTLIGLTVLCLIVGIGAIVFFEEITGGNRAILIITSSLGLFASIVGLFSVHYFLQWQRKHTSQKVFAAWQESLTKGNPPNIDSGHLLSEGALRILAMQLFARIGYGIQNKEADEGYVRLLNPHGQLELVACRQQPSPLGIKPIYEFRADIEKDGAVQGHFWAAGGFTPEAAQWAGQKSILLADRQGIGQFIDSVLANHSRLLE